MGASLVVLDLDSAVMACDGTVDRTDRDAIHRARADGLVFAFASSRRFASVSSLLRTHGLDGWIIGCDGAQLGMSRREHVISRNTIASAIAVRARELLIAHGLEPLAMSSEGVHGPAAREGTARALFGAAADRTIERPPLLTEIHALVGSGDPASVEVARKRLDELAPTRIRATTYELPEGRAVRVDACRSSRARAVRDLAARTKIRRPDIAYVGGHGVGYVDRSPFDQLAHVYVPHGASAELAPQAEPLGRAAGGGAVAEAIERWIRASVRELRV